MSRDEIPVSSDLLESIAFESGRTITRELTLRPTHAELRINGRLFKAPLPLPVVPEQRAAGEAS